MWPTMPDDASALVALLPHRPPFLFIDDVDAVEPSVNIRAHYRVTGSEPFLAGHFPGNPIFPGVLQLEALAQAGAIAVLADARFAGRLPLFGGVEDARFRRLVRPGDILDLAVDIERLSARGGWGRAVASVASAECCRARLLFAFAWVDRGSARFALALLLAEPLQRGELRSRVLARVLDTGCRRNGRLLRILPEQEPGLDLARQRRFRTNSS